MNYGSAIRATTPRKLSQPISLGIENTCMDADGAQ